MQDALQRVSRWVMFRTAFAQLPVAARDRMGSIHHLSSMDRFENEFEVHLKIAVENEPVLEDKIFMCLINTIFNGTEWLRSEWMRALSSHTPFGFPLRERWSVIEAALPECVSLKSRAGSGLKLGSKDEPTSYRSSIPFFRLGNPRPFGLGGRPTNFTEGTLVRTLAAGIDQMRTFLGLPKTYSWQASITFLELQDVLPLCKQATTVEEVEVFMDYMVTKCFAWGGLSTNIFVYKLIDTGVFPPVDPLAFL
ncbi:hypothetical protein CYMTET_41586, partial [Cymbomonas tetramitiformis]